MNCTVALCRDELLRERPCGRLVSVVMSGHAPVGAADSGVIARLPGLDSCLPGIGHRFGSFKPDGRLHAPVSRVIYSDPLIGRRHGLRFQALLRPARLDTCLARVGSGFGLLELNRRLHSSVALVIHPNLSARVNQCHRGGTAEEKRRF